MGVPKFFRYISERYPCLSELVREYQIPEFDNLYLDMNGIIHMCSHPDDNDVHFRISEEKIFKDIFHYIEVLFRMIKPRKLFFMAVDGVAPRAKMNQQRSRRLRSAKDAEVQELKAKIRGEELPSEMRFDSNCITPGTGFMARLQEHLKYFVTKNVSTNKLWQKCKIILSGHETPGEGEHKIMDYIRYMKAQPNYDPNTRHCLYGLDADLIMLGLCTHEPHFSLLREEIRFNKKAKRQNVPELINFYLLHLSLMREYLELEFMPLKETLPFEYDMEKIIDDWVLMGFLVGNDFIPHLPNLHIVNGALPVLYNTYMKILPTLDGYINEAGQLNLPRFEKFMAALAEIDMTNFSEQYADLKYFQGKMNMEQQPRYRPKEMEMWNADISAVANPQEPVTRNKDLEALIKTTDEMFHTPLNEDLEKLIEATDDLLLDIVNVETTKSGESNPETIKETPKAKVKLLEPSISNLNELAIDFDPEDEDGSSVYFSGLESDDELMNAEFLQHKHDYYINKLDYANVTPEVLRMEAEGYVRAIQWNLHYYYNGVCSWSWFYPHHYAPYISDIKDFADLKLEFEMGKPFKPFEQLLAVLPAASKDLLPEAYQDLMTASDSPIIEYYPRDFRTDRNGKRQEWEAIVLIPFIDEAELLKAMEPCNKKLSQEEQQRNTHGPMLVYQYTPECLGRYQGPECYPELDSNFAQVNLVSIEEIRVPVDKLVKGRYPGSVCDVYYLGFPTFKHLKYRGSLSKAKVRVFEMASQNENMVITIVPPAPITKSDTQPLAKKILGRKVYIGWPHLRVAMVHAVSDSNIKYLSKGKPGYYSTEPNKDNSSNLWHMQRESATKHYRERLGIEVGATTILVHVKTLVGRKYVVTEQGQVNAEEMWSEAESSCPLQAIVMDLVIHESEHKSFQTLQDMFPVGSKCFKIGRPHYGSLGEVLENNALKGGRIKVCFDVQDEPNMRFLEEQANKTKYLSAMNAAQNLGISHHLLARLTGQIYIVSENTNAEHSSRRRHTNIGLTLKLNKQNEEIPGYTRKVADHWQYSSKAMRLVFEYIEAFPELVKYLQANLGKNEFYESELPLNKDGSGTVQEIVRWVKSQPYLSVPFQKVGTKMLLPDAINDIIQFINKFPEPRKKVIVQVLPHMLFKPELQSEFVPPDDTVTYKLYDRVINVRDSFTVPFGLKGTVVGIECNGDNSLDMMLDVIFDQEFAGGVKLHSDSPRGYRLPKHALINISHDGRVDRKDNLQPLPLPADLTDRKAFKKPNVPLNMQSQNSAFVSWNPPSGPNYPMPLMSVRPLLRPQQPAVYKYQPQIIKQPPRPQNHINYEFKAFLKELEKNQPKQKEQNVLINNVQNNPKALLASPSTSQGVHYDNHQHLHTSPRKTAQHARVSNGTDTLRKLLKVSESPKSPSSPQNHNSQPISVQSLFAHARSTEQRALQARPGGRPYFTVLLLNYCQAQGIGIPRYNYFRMAQDKFQAQIMLADGKVMFGLECPSKEEAAESAASLFMSEVNKAGAGQSPQLPFAVPNGGLGPRRFPSPPKQWCQSQPGGSRPGPAPGPHKSLVFTNKAFVPLQAVKQHWTKRGGGSAPPAEPPASEGSRRAATPPASKPEDGAKTSSAQVPEGPANPNPRPRPRRPRIAANFGNLSPGLQ